MSPVRGISVVGLLFGAGCWLSHTPAPEEVALDVYQEAEDLFASGQYQDALPKYEFVIRARDRWKDPYVKLARCREALGREDLAIGILDRLLRIDDCDEEALDRLGRLWARRGEPARALQYYRRLRDLRPGDGALDSEIARLESIGKP